ncbi:MAG: class I SAM-dependent methyltransferase [Cytophagia bacterium]|nr:class I SAM-dependent methyltransferase [Cytophagia bacterium]
MNSTRQKQEEIYRGLYTEHKGTPMAVSSESLNHKNQRFKLITNIFKDQTDVSVHDVGMGLADLYAFIQTEIKETNVQYSGTDILREFVEESRLRFPECRFYHRDIAESAFEDTYDYVLLSGVFHQRRDSSIREWELFWQKMIKNAFLMSRKGVAFNFVSPFVDFYQTQSYYCNLPKLLNFINDDLSRFFEIKHDYALFEFTVYVYQESYIKSITPEPEFQKYFK